jgi:hypothetical protein
MAASASSSAARLAAPLSDSAWRNMLHRRSQDTHLFTFAFHELSGKE